MATLISSPNFSALMLMIEHQFEVASQKVHTGKWQGVDIRSKPEMATHELLNISMGVPLFTTDLDVYRQDVLPNLPWADDHFRERVMGMPLNPGVQWANWPYAKSADTFREDGIFNHTYMERYWPKHANCDAVFAATSVREGIRHTYGDLYDLVELLAREPDTRQAWLPIFFPEDTGIGDGGRKPCTLGYQFIMRNNQLHVYYPLRSCDFVRHFRDDVYLTIRLLLWVIEQCACINPFWKRVMPGTYTMHCTSLHIFENDFRILMEKRS